MITKEDIISIIKGVVSQKNAFIVEVKVSSSNHITVEVDSFKGISIDDCVEISRLIENNLNRDIEDYELEVSSAGLSSAFKVVEQYHKNTRNEIEVIIKSGKKLTGILKQVNETGIVLETKTLKRIEGKKKKQEFVEELPLTFADIKSTKLVIHFK